MKLIGKTALVTGGAVRIGRAICEALAGCGCNVVIHFNPSGDEALKLVSALKRKSIKAIAVQGDLSSENGCLSLMEKAWDSAGSIDILVNNAAVFHKDGLDSATVESFMGEFNVNFVAPMVLTRAFHHRISRAGARSRSGGDREGGLHGKIVNLLDRRITGSESGCVAYVLSKKMLAEFTRIAALDLAPYVTVNGVAPGAVLAPAAPRGGGSGADRTRDLAGKIPMARRCTADDVASAVMFLLESDGITGQVIYVDGGQHLLGGIEQ
jgi:NAD(P)-dependent dehydrogenase (short-subunit alcohol dehydrogenase family)